MNEQEPLTRYGARASASSVAADEIPLHMLEGFRYYRSPFAEWNLEDQDYAQLELPAATYQQVMAADDHYRWDRARGKFADTGDPSELQRMLEHVTADNPPLNPYLYEEPEVTRHWSGQEIAGVCFAVLCALTVAGVVGGFKAFAGVFVVLFVIYAIGWIVH